MYERTFRLVAGVAILLSHVALCSYCYYALSGRMPPEKLISTLMILVPVFGVFASVVVNYASENMKGVGKRGSKVNPLFISAFCICFVAHVVLVSMIVKAFAVDQTIQSPEQLQQFIGYSEAAFGFLLGTMITKSFS